MRWSNEEKAKFNESLARHRAESVINEAKSGKWEYDFDLVAAKLLDYAELIDRIRLGLLVANPHDEEGEYALLGLVDNISYMLEEYCVAPCEKQMCDRCGNEQNAPICVTCEIEIKNGAPRWPDAEANNDQANG